MASWFDVPWCSVVNLDGSDPSQQENMSNVPRLVVYEVAGYPGQWGTRCISVNNFVPEMWPFWPSRDQAKKAIEQFARQTLDGRWHAAIPTT